MTGAPGTRALGYAVPLALAAKQAAGHRGAIMEITYDTGRRFFAGLGTYRAIKRRAAAMRAAMAPEESAALLVPERLYVSPSFEPLTAGSFKRAMHAMARERGGLA